MAGRTKKVLRRRGDGYVTPFEKHYDFGPRACVVRLSGDIDMSVVPELRKDLDGALDAGCANLVLDLTAVDYADSSALGLLVWLNHRLRPASGRLVLAGANRDVSRILEISGLISVASTIATSANLASALEGLELGEPVSEPTWTQSIEVTPDPDRLAGAREDVCAMLADLGMPESALFDIKVALGEALANAIRHGVPRKGSAHIEVHVSAYDDRIVLAVTDNGPGFDGLSRKKRELYESSGRGVDFMRALMDRVEFSEPEGGGTTVSLVKHRVGTR